MKNKRKPRQIPPVEPTGYGQSAGQHDHPHVAPGPDGQLRRVPVNEVPAPKPVRNHPASFRSRAGAISGRPGQPRRGMDGGSPAGGGSGPGYPSRGPGYPGQGSGFPGQEQGHGFPGQGNGPGFPGQGNGPGRPGKGHRDPRRRSRHRGLKIFLIVVLVLILGILGSAYLFWNSMMSKVNIISPTGANAVTIPSEYNVPTESLSNPVPVEQGVINVLLLGADAREEDVIQTNTDSMMILTIDQGNKKIKLTSLQRDMLVWMPGRSEPAKLNAANAYGGPALAMRVVNDTFRLNIENYVIVNMRGMEALIDIAGGIAVNVDKDELYYVNQMIGYQNSIYPETPPSKNLTKSGMQQLDGRQAVAFGRIRKGDSDYARMARQRVVMQALFGRFMQAGIGTKTSMMSKGLSYITTNFSKTQLTSFGLSSLPLMSGTIEQLQIPIEGYYVEDPEPVWVNRCDFNGMIPLLQKFIYGRTYPFDPVKKIPGAPNSGTKVTTGTTHATTRATTKAAVTPPATTATRLTVDPTTTRSGSESTTTATSGSTSSTSSTSHATSATTTEATTGKTTKPIETSATTTATTTKANGAPVPSVP